MLPRYRILLGLLGLALLAPMVPAQGQGLLVDRRPRVPVPRSYEVKEVSVEAKVKEQVAEVRVSQTFHNPGSFELEAEYLFPIPEDSAIQDFVLMVDGRELPGRLLGKDEARRIYEEVVRSKRDPALLEYMGRGLFRTSVFPIPPGADRKVTLRYTQLLKREGEVIEFNYPFGTQKFTAKPIERLSLRLDIDSKAPIKSLYSPGHDVEIRRSGEHEASVKLVQHDVIPTADFRLLMTVAEGEVGATVLSYRPSAGEDGYFMLLASPKVQGPDEKPRPKTVVFVLDRSGSMSGKKIEQARESLKFVLNNLRENDLFNIVVYDDRVEMYKPELQRYNSEAREAAIRFVENIRPGGSTNIDGALREALGLIQDDSRPNYVLFLTDGLPTAGETRETAIAEHVKEANRRGARVFSFGVGFDVNARLLDRISGGNAGATEYVKPDEDIEAKVSRFFAKLTSPVLSRIEIEVTGTDVNRTYPRDVPDLFAGGQLVWVGRYRESGKARVKIRGKVGDDRQSYEFPVELAEAGEGSRYDFVERLWAVRRVGYIVDQIDLHGQNSELTNELVELSKKYGILTPYTSFLADERTGLHAASEHRRLAEERLSELSLVDGAAGVGQRSNKMAYLNAERELGVASQPQAPALARAAPAQAGSGPQAAGAEAGRPARNRSFGGATGAGGRAAGAAGDALSGGAGGYSGMYRFQQGRPALAKDKEGRDVVVETVRNVGRKTFYKRGDRWVDAEIKPEDEAKAERIVQFSDAYFKLARAQDSELNQYLTFTEPVLIKLPDRIVRLDPAAEESR